MSRCTAPVRGHSSAAAAAACPACRYRSSYRYSGYDSSYSSPASSGVSYGSSGGGGGGRSVSSSRPRWSKAGSSLLYTPAQVQSLTPVRQTVETRAAEQPDLRDVFLCHAWDDRQGPAKELHELLVAAGVKVWFSEKDLGLGVPMMRAIDKGASPTKSFRFSWRVTSSFPSCTTRHMQLSAMSALCSPPEAAWTLRKIQWP
jgi:hypothetical protein